MKVLRIQAARGESSLSGGPVTPARMPAKLVKNHHARKKKTLISLVDSKEYSDVEITPPTQTSKALKQPSFGTASRKPMFQSTLDGGSASSAQACSHKKYVPMKSVIREGRRKPSTQGLST
ncbi:hypothetical protein HID58_017902 [Brassica napus]|uniref:Uncharacterized protein n=1 Tax=Brassica napus TaxID=3708 RepID=A0ABQ8D8H8_BRANA|nr:hypothetical protein HID58_017902 [Brassica napus]